MLRPSVSRLSHERHSIHIQTHRQPLHIPSDSFCMEAVAGSIGVCRTLACILGFSSLDVPHSVVSVLISVDLVVSALYSTHDCTLSTISTFGSRPEVSYNIPPSGNIYPSISDSSHVLYLVLLHSALHAVLSLSYHCMRCTLSWQRTTPASTTAISPYMHIQRPLPVSLRYLSRYRAFSCT